MKSSPHLNLIAHTGHHAALNTGRFSLRGRESWVLSWSIDGRLYEGEASPLEGFGADSATACHQELVDLDSELLVELSESCAQANAPLEELGRISPHFESPAARFAFETVVLGRVAHLLGVPLWQLIKRFAGHSDPTPSRLPVSAVIDPSWTDWELRADALFGQGVRTFKIKVGRDLNAELRCLSALSARFGPELRVRLDPNQAWSAHEMTVLSREAFEFDFEWIEDPTSEADGWRELESSVPFAADEILIGEDPSTFFLDLLGAHFVLLKPMALGGFLACLAWAHVARQSRRPVSISHLFDGPRALDACVHLAFALQTPGLTPGLGLHAGLEGWAEEPQYVKVDHLVLPGFGP